MFRILQKILNFQFIRQLIEKAYFINFPGSVLYWELRYRKGGNSGAGSYNHLARWKADIINQFISQNRIECVIELGCGDGNQLSLFNCKKYIGLDVSATAISLCKNKFQSDITKSFFFYNPIYFVDNHKLFTAELALSLDVIYHLIEEEMYHAYMQTLFSVANKYVIIYSSNREGTANYHVRERRFTDWVNKYACNWKLIQKIENPYPYNPDDPSNTSISDFYIFESVNLLKTL